MEQKKGHLVISLDLELYWGMFDKVTLAEYGEHIKGERTAIPRMLQMFREYGIRATWATVGMLMARNKEELLSYLPEEKLRPQYEDMSVSSYEHIKHADLGTVDEPSIYYFGNDLIRKILSMPFQEIGNHTFSHFYCIDGHINEPSIFIADLEAHKRISKTYDITPNTIVFPRNQASNEALLLCAKHGILAYRGNEDHVLYRARKDNEQSYLIRAFRLLDHYINMSGHHTYPTPRKTNPDIPINIPSSRFLRPWIRALALFEPLRMRRIKNAMTYAAKRGEVFHLWWHPHNMGINQEENFRNLEDILTHFKVLEKRYGMQSASMGELAK